MHPFSLELCTCRDAAVIHNTYDSEGLIRSPVGWICGKLMRVFEAVLLSIRLRQMSVSRAEVDIIVYLRWFRPMK